jgi:hypothetical protein
VSGGRKVLAVGVKAKFAAELRRTKFGPERILCVECALESVERNLEECDIATRIIRQSEVATMFIPSCDACDVSFVRMLEEVSK